MTTYAQPPADTTTAIRSDHRRLDIQGLRAVAVLLVVLYHAGLPVPGGFVGVDVFFVISGYVITAMLHREWLARGRLDLGRFYLRRFLRLTPALALLVGVVALVSLVLQNPFGAQQTTARTGIGAMLLTANYVIGHSSGNYFAEAAITNPLLHTWSLSVEEQFYLVFPALLVLGWLLVRWRAIAPVVLVSAIAVGSFALSLLWSYDASFASGLTDVFGGAASFAYYSSITRAWEFAAGALLVLVPVGRLVGTGGQRLALGLGGAALILVSAFAINDGQPFPGTIALLPVAGSVLLILAGSGPGGVVSRALSIRPMVAIGDRSYSWYLWHWPFIVFTALLFPGRPVLLVVAAAASLLPAALSYRYVEQPLRRHRPATRVRAGALIGTTVGIPLVLCTALLVGANAGWGLAPPTPASPSGAASVVVGENPPTSTTTDAASGTAELEPEQEEPGDGDGGGSLRSQHAVVRAGCVNTDLDPIGCRFGPSAATGTVLLAGDSQAYALADGVIEAAAEMGYDTVATSHTGCPFLARESSGVHNYPCASWQQEIVEYALQTRPAAVVIANRSGGYVRPDKDWRTIARDDGSRTADQDEATELYADALGDVVTELNDAGVPVVVIASVPEMVGFSNRTSLLSEAFGSQVFTVDRADAEDDRSPALAVEQTLAERLAGVVVYDPNPDLCFDDLCAVERDGEPVYQDQYHLAVPGSLRLVDGIGGTIRDAMAEVSSAR